MVNNNMTGDPGRKPGMLYATAGADPGRAEQLADHLALQLTEDMPEPGSLYLRLDGQGLALTDGELLMRGDLTAKISRLTHANLTHELLVKAAKIKNAGDAQRVLDATAGMGEDSLLLAAAGYEVDLYEQDPIIAALLEDSLRRACDMPELAETVARMHFHEGDSIAAMESMAEGGQGPEPDIIVLDPMFPERNKTALIKKKFQLLQQLERPCDNEERLLQAAMKAHPRRIVIKRPAKGPWLAGVKPSYSLDGKAIRYDCIVL